MFRSQSANRIDELYYKGMRLRRDAAARIGTKSGARGAVRGGRLGDEVTSQTQAIQSIADIADILQRFDFFSGCGGCSFSVSSTTFCSPVLNAMDTRGFTAAPSPSPAPDPPRSRSRS